MFPADLFYVRRHPDKAPTGWRDLTPHDLVAAGRYIIIATFLANPLNTKTHAYAFKIAGWDDVLMMAQWYRRASRAA
jgi:hypothetical protein